MYGIIHPAEQWESGRPTCGRPRLRPGARPRARCSTRRRAGSGRSGTSPTRRCSSGTPGRLMPRTGEWESRWWSPIINAEHLAMRESAALIDLSAFAVLDVAGPGALAAVQHLAVAQLDVADRPGRLHLAARRRGRVPRRPDDHAAGGRRVPGRDRRRHRHDGPEVDHRSPARRRCGPGSVTDVTSAWTTLGLWGPKAQGDPRRGSPSGDVSHRGFAFGTCKEIEVGGVTVLASRISYVGELGWELHLPDRAGRPAVGRALGRWPAVGADPGRASACTGRPAGWRRGTARSAPS